MSLIVDSDHLLNPQQLSRHRYRLHHENAILTVCVSLIECKKPLPPTLQDRARLCEGGELVFSKSDDTKLVFEI